MEISVEQHRKGRKILGYIFRVRNKEEYQVELIPEEDERITFLKTITGAPYYFNPKTLDKLVSQYGWTSVKNNFEYTKRHKPNNFAAYLYHTVTHQIAEHEMEVKQIQQVQPDYKSTMPSELVETPDLFTKQKTIDQILEEEKVDIDEYVFQNPQLAEMYRKFKERADQINKSGD